MPQPPQLDNVRLSTHVPLHGMKLTLSHAQLPLVQVAPVAHSRPQRPQLSSSV
jgi:hypothetical protein